MAGKMCVVRVRASPHPNNTPLIRLRLNGILLCEANGRCRDDRRIRSLQETTAVKDVRAPKSVRSRRRGKPIEVWVTDEERIAISELAEQAGLSRSAFLRAAGLNKRVGARADLEAVRELVKVNGDLGRIGGLLKLWLAEKRGQGASPIDVEQMMIGFRVLQGEIRKRMSAIVYGRK